MEILGLDIGGSAIKGAIIDTKTGNLVSGKHKVETPQPATPQAMAQAVKELVTDIFNWEGVVGCSFPTIVLDGKALSYGNIDPSWVGTQIDTLFEQVCPNTKFHVANDADLAGIAEMRIGSGVGLQGKVIMVTIGTGLGSGVFYNGELIPNIELGRIFGKDGQPIEFYAAASARRKENLSFKDWAKRFEFFLHHIDRTFSPNHYIISGGISEEYDKFKDFINTPTQIHLARFRNNSGIVGGAMYAEGFVIQEQSL